MKIKKEVVKTEDLKIGDRISFKMNKRLRLAQLEMMGADYLASKLSESYDMYSADKVSEILQTIGDLKYTPSRKMWKYLYKRANIEKSCGQKFVMVVNWPARQLIVKKLHPDYKATEELKSEE